VAQPLPFRQRKSTPMTDTHRPYQAGPEGQTLAPQKARLRRAGHGSAGAIHGGPYQACGR